MVVFDCGRFDFEGEDKAKLDRVQKFYSMIPDQVEFRPYTPESARRLAQEAVRRLGLQLGVAELGFLIEALGSDGGRILQELEKLSLYAGRDRKVTLEDIRRLVPNAQATTVFALVGALGRGDRKRSLDILDTLLREGEYLPLALTFLATQFRLALGSARSEPEEFPADSGVLHETGDSGLARPRGTNSADAGGVPERPPGCRH